jgi:hypothetical protein
MFADLPSDRLYFKGGTSHPADRLVVGNFPIPRLPGATPRELQTVAAIGFRSDGFRNLTADELTTLAAITRMEEFAARSRDVTPPSPVTR